MNRKLNNLSALLKIRILKKSFLFKELKHKITAIENQLLQAKEHAAHISFTRHQSFLRRSYTHEYDKYLERLQREQTSLHKQYMSLKMHLHDSYADIQKQTNQRKIIEKIRSNKYPTKSTNN